MKSIITLFKKSLSFPIIWIGVIYLFWWLFTLTNDAFINGIIILGVYFIITILEILLLLSKNKALKTALFVILSCLTLFSLILAISEGYRWIFDAPLYRRHLIYIPLIIVFSSYKIYDLIQGSLSRDKVLLIHLFIVTFPVLVINIAYPISFFPEIVDKKEFEDFKYYIVWQHDTEYRSYTSFYKCENWSFECNYLPRSLPYIDKIIIDKDRNEVSAINSNVGLDSTDGDNPRRYEGLSVQLGDHVYQMAIDDHDYRECMSTPSCNSYTYTLYECDLDYTSCDPLPVQYTETNHEYEWGYLDVNEATSEINAYSIKDSLIFTYGENPVCHIDRCVILDQ